MLPLHLAIFIAVHSYHKLSGYEMVQFPEISHDSEEVRSKVTAFDCNRAVIAMLCKKYIAIPLPLPDQQCNEDDTIETFI